MNAIHDMGGMDGFGAVEPEAGEPVFHHRWEGRVFALTRGVEPWRQGRSWAGFRFIIESIPPGEYLRMSYYERWFYMMIRRLLDSGLVSDTELATGSADPDAQKPELLPPGNTGSPLGSGLLSLDIAARFQPGDRLRARNLHPRGHTRQPRYLRGCEGVVAEDHGVYDLQDTDEKGRRPSPRPQHVYSVRFEARELWGERAARGDSVYVDLWEDYLEPV